MAKVVPAPVEPSIILQFDGVAPSRTSRRRQSTSSRFEGLSQDEKHQALAFRALVQPRTRYSLLATLVVCALLVLLVGVPYAVNELMAGASPMLQTAMRGLIVWIWAYFILGPMNFGFAPTLVRGGFHPRFLLSVPLTLGPAVGVAFIPVGGSTLGIISIALSTLGIGFVLCVLLLNAPFFATDEHKALDQSFGPPLFAIGALFFGLIAAHVMLTQLYSSPLVGLVLPAGSVAIRHLAIFVLVQSFHTFYFEPKKKFLTPLLVSAQNQEDMVPPLLGDVEALYGYIAAGFALIIGNAASVATVVEAMLSPDSTAWVLSLFVSWLIEVLTRTGIQQRFELWVAARLEAKYDLQWPMRIAQVTALKLVYLHSLGGTGYVAPTMALCIGSVRAATFGDPAAIVWLDVSPTVWRVLLAQLVSQIVGDAAVRAMKKMGQQQFELSARFAAGHPLSISAFRDFDIQGYAVAFSMGGMFIYGVFIAFLGPAFVTGMCRSIAPATQVWVVNALECVKSVVDAQSAGGLVNGSAVPEY
jgi:hypothetical protein